MIIASVNDFIKTKTKITNNQCMKKKYFNAWLLSKSNHLKALPPQKLFSLLLTAACLSQNPVQAGTTVKDAGSLAYNAGTFNIKDAVLQATEVRGKVLDESGTGMPGVTVLVKGTTVGTATDMNGNFSLNVPDASGTLVFSFIGYKTQEQPINNQTVINVTMEVEAKSLEEIVVTGYTTQAKRDIIGAVTVVESEDLLATPAANVAQQLQGRAAGVVTSGTGQPGAGAKVRVRGFGSFGANDPLYVVDGVPTFNVNEINPNDIESMQVLKDASAASIYGSRAANGVIIITTRQGKGGAPKFNVSSYTGVQVAPKGPDLLNTEQYGQYLWRSAAGAGRPMGTLNPDGNPYGHAQYGNGANPVIPEYLYIKDTDPSSPYNINPARPFNQIVRANREGTDWWDAVFDPALIQNHQLGVSGSSEFTNYALSFNYFNQEGIAKYTNYKRYSVRANTTTTLAKRLRIGENLQISYNHGNIGNTSGGESDIQHIYVMQPIVPVYDEGGNFAGSRGSELGNSRNPVAELYRQRDNVNTNMRLFGNVFAELDLFKGLTARTSFGTDYNTRYDRNFGYATYERAENVGTNSYRERNDYNLNWVWSNTLVYKQRLAEVHDMTFLLGTEAVENSSRGVGGSRVGFYTDDPDFRILSNGSSGINNFSYGAITKLSSVFARADYGFQDKYLFNATVRRDGSSVFSSRYRYGVFPALGAAWRISGEEFMNSFPAISDLKLRAGWGKMGNQLSVDPNNSLTLYRTAAAGNGYDIGGSSTSIQPGYDTDRFGNPNTKWEASTTTNIGVDLSLWNNKVNVTLDAYNRRTNDLLVRGQAAGPAGEATRPFINLGDIRNRGIDLAMNTSGNITSDLKFDVSLSFSAYRNEVLRVGDNDEAFFDSYASRWGQNISRTQKGQPLGSFYGYKIAGFFNNEAELGEIEQSGKRVGGWRFEDLNKDGKIDGDDRTFIGNPHPDFTTGLNLALMYKGFDFNTFFYASVGNQLFNYSKYFTDFNTFQGNRSTRVLTDTWTPENQNAALPSLNADDFSSNSVTHDYYVEDGSFLRARTMQLGYTLPTNLIKRSGLASARVYLQAQNLFTITGYSGIDPDLSFMNQGGNAAQADLNIGIDAGGYIPNPKQFLIGVNFGF
jgi:TonB-linked SusC/RagA family outer membrane protein